MAAFRTDKSSYTYNNPQNLGFSLYMTDINTMTAMSKSGIEPADVHTAYQ